MISGALLLPSAAPLGNFLSSRAIRIIPVLCFWTVVYAAWLAQSPHEFAALLGRALSTPVMFHLWYLYALVGLYAFAPVLAAFYRHNGESAKIYFLSMWAITAALFPTLNGAFNLGLSIDAVSARLFRRFGRLFCFGSHSLRVAGTQQAGPLADGLFRVQHPNGAVHLRHLCRARCAGRILLPLSRRFVMLASIGFFLLFLTWGPPLGEELLIRISELSLGIYCVHVLVLKELCNLGLFAAGLLQHPWLFIPITSGCVLLISAPAIWLMRLVRPLRWVT